MSHALCTTSRWWCKSTKLCNDSTSLPHIILLHCFCTPAIRGKKIEGITSLSHLRSSTICMTLSINNSNIEIMLVWAGVVLLHDKQICQVMLIATIKCKFDIVLCHTNVSSLWKIHAHPSPWTFLTRVIVNGCRVMSFTHKDICVARMAVAAIARAVCRQLKAHLFKMLTQKVCIIIQHLIFIIFFWQLVKVERLIAPHIITLCLCTPCCCPLFPAVHKAVVAQSSRTSWWRTFGDEIGKALLHCLVCIAFLVHTWLVAIHIISLHEHLIKECYLHLIVAHALFVHIKLLCVDIFLLHEHLIKEC